MSKNLLITEKPSVAMEFAKVLNSNGTRKDGYIESDQWIITWCVGHLVTMSYPEKYDEKYKFWRLDTLPFIPKEYKYEVISNVKKQFQIIEQLVKREDVNAIYVATDSGREGEYIYRLVDQMIGVTGKDRKRVWIDSQTEEEIKRGIKEAKNLEEYNSLADSAYLRAKEDYLIGINFSRLLSIIYGKRLAKELEEEKVSISVGRVMTCVLGMVVSREREIRDFIKTPYYKVLGIFDQINAEWKTSEKSEYYQSTQLYNETGFKKKENAEKMITKLQGKKAIVSDVKKTKQKENPPLLFNLAELQNECTKRFKIKPDETLEIVQNLYEKKLVTYPRTDARVLSSAVAKVITKNLNGIAKGFNDTEIKGYINEMSAKKYSTNLSKTKYVNDSKITDHYAIIPTGQGYENFEKLPDLQKQIYKMIVKRFLAIFYPAAEFNKISLKVDIHNNDKIEEFYDSNRICVEEGYLKIWNNVSTEEEQNVENNNKNKSQNEIKQSFLSQLKKGQELEVSNFEIKEAQTSPPTRYNSGSIILAMENAGKLIEEEELREQIKGAGIGTSATRAEIIKKLERISYIQINTKTQIITPTQKGEAIYDIVNKSMPDMLNPKLTASWEKGLEMVANKDINAEEFMKKLEAYICLKFDKLVIKR